MSVNALAAQIVSEVLDIQVKPHEVAATKRSIEGRGWGAFDPEYGDDMVVETARLAGIALTEAEELLLNGLRARLVAQQAQEAIHATVHACTTWWH